MSTFLVEYDPESGRVDLREYPHGDRERAQADLLAREKRNAKDRVRREVVLLEADNEEALRVTHGRYFKTLRELIEA